MAPKKNAAQPAPSAAATSQSSTTAAGSVPAPVGAAPVSTPVSAPAAKSAPANWDKVLQNIYSYYMNETPQRTKLIDVFLVFIAVVGALQFLYCILAGNYPFNAFLSGFGATVGQFVLTISLRIQTAAVNKSDFPEVSPERAFADYVVCSLILHFFCVNFIN
ncbi:hypothetical protein N5P37_004109 [Trichoderma harzianum]|uniref:Dolichyl-diphosphooligosaccharide--protein glycosyltransferase subunit OST2 n=1 Tax=Trichoderma harzianum CBS 226.95 TaxID=983964 RepID=A0A2T4ANP3_TRIHA|nr:hypothetical protein M431DRAFT_75890 [Trichoderma harzianum CBS 226.95]KAK0763125.1 hypothetical protein N5P37_004109 [Trichoderma harzianum]PKK44850.1 hypothetical protein CI102_10055 [Trichoderma harzianum]PTB58706.1 hypothetical protein M431DRAFT_75890 [Trichoderma harzianum CBS 226.95]